MAINQRNKNKTLLHRLFNLKIFNYFTPCGKIEIIKKAYNSSYKILKSIKTQSKSVVLYNSYSIQ